MKSILKNWKTTVGAVLAMLLFGAGESGIEVANVDSWGEFVGILTGFGAMLFARDSDVTSEESGADLVSNARKVRRGK